MIDWLLGRRRAVLAAFGILLVPAIWLVLILPLQTDLLQLLPDDVPEIKLLRKLETWGITLGFTYVGLVAKDETPPEALMEIADGAIESLRDSKWVSYLDGGIDLGILLRSAPLLVDPEDIPKLTEAVSQHLRAEKRKRSGFFIDLEDEESAEDPFAALREKYAARFQIPGAGEPGAGIESMFTRLDKAGEHVRYLSSNGRMLIFPMRPTFSLFADQRWFELLADIERALAKGLARAPDAKVEVIIGGAYPLEHEQRWTITTDAARAAGLSFLCIVAVALVALRRLRIVLAVFGSLAVAMTLTFGVVRLTAGSVNMITVFLLAILAGLGVDFGLYFATRRDLLLARGFDELESTKEAWRQTAVPSALGAITTMSTFTLLAFGEFRGFSQLGVISAIGMVMAWLAMYLLLPVLVARLPGGRDVKRARRFLVIAPWATLAAALAVTAAAALSAPRVRFVYEGNELTVEGQKSLEIDRRILEHFGEVIDRVVVVEENEERARSIHQFFEDNFGKLANVARYDSAFPYLPPQSKQLAARERFPELREALDRLPGRSEDPAASWLLEKVKALRDPPLITLADLPPAILHRHVGLGPNGEPVGYVGLIAPKESLWNVRALETFVNDVAALRVDGKPLQLTGRAQVFWRIIRMVRSEAYMFSLIGGALVLSILWLQWRSLRLALLSMLPLVAGLVWTFGAMPLVGKGLNLTFMNIIVFPVLIGLSVSYGIQIVYAYRLYGSAAEAVSVTRRAILGSAATTLAGWATLISAKMIGLRGMGWLATLGMLSVTAFSLLVLPAVLELLHRRGWIHPKEPAVEQATPQTAA